MTKDMTSGKPMKLILQFMVPLLLGNLFQQMYNLIDSIIVGRFINIDALASVGASSSITFLIIGFVMGTCSGFAIPVAQMFGAKKESEMRRYVFNSAILSTIIAAVITVVTSALCYRILVWMGTPENILKGAYDYLIVIFIGIPFTFLYNILSGIIRSLGDSRTPFIFLIISTVINIIGDLVLILIFDMGVMGAGIATIAAQAISGILCLVYMIRRFPILRMTKEERRADSRKMKVLLFMGLPMGLQFSITAIGSIMLQSAINALGSVAVASYTAAIKIKQLMMCPFDAMANTMATYGGQNLGAGKIDRIYKGLKDSLLVGTLYGVFAGIVMHFWGGILPQLFVDKSNTEVILGAHQYLRTIGYFYVVLAFLNILRCTIQGLGYSAQAFFAGVFEMTARTLMAVLVIPKGGYTAACFTDPAAWFSAVLFLLPLFFIVMKKIEKQYSKTAESSFEQVTDKQKHENNTKTT